jgi:diguanylate cyclase (GGDEF)-like protein
LKKKQDVIPGPGAKASEEAANLTGQIVADMPAENLAQSNGTAEKRLAERMFLLQETNRRLLEELNGREEMEAELRKKNRQFIALYDIARVAAGSLNVEEILQETLSITLFALELEAGGIFLVEADSGNLVLRAHAGVSQPTLEKIQLLLPHEGLVGNAVATGKPVTMQSLDSAPQKDFIEKIHLEGWTSAVAVPLTAGSEIIGAMVVAARQPEPPPYTSIEFIEAIGHELGQSIHHVQLFERLQAEFKYRGMAEEFLSRQADTMKALYETFLEINAQQDLNTLLQAIVRRAATLLNSSMGGLYVMDPDRQSLRLVVGHNISASIIGRTLRLGEGLSGQVALVGKTLMVSDYSKWEGRSIKYEGSSFRRLMAAPLKTGSDVMGVILVGDTQVGDYSEDEIRLVSLFADQAALALEKARLYEAERLRNAELARSNGLLAALTQVSALLETTFEPNQLMARVGIELQQRGFGMLIALMDKTNRDLVVQYTSIQAELLKQAEAMLGARLNQMRIPRSFHSASDLLLNRRPVFENDPVAMVEAFLPTARPRLVKHALQLMGITEHSAAIALPLVTHDQAVGIMVVWSEDVHLEDISVFYIFANQVAAALENARLYADIQRQAIMDELTGLYNRRGFFTLVEQQIRVLARMKKTALLIFVDIDEMKRINDTYGHQAGDQALVDSAAILKKTFRESDIVARMGGDEFAIFAIESSDANPESVERLERNIRAFNMITQRPFKLSLSLGTMNWSPDSTINLDELLGRADKSMYEHKLAKKGLTP